MADPSQHQSAPSRRWWTHLWRWLWRGFGLLWGLIIVGVVVNIASTRLTSDQGFPPDSPAGLALRNLPLTIAVGVILLLLTLLIGLLHRQSTAHGSQAASPLPLPPQQSRDTLIRTLSQEYTRRLTHSLQGAAMMVLGLHERTDLTISSGSPSFAIPLWPENTRFHLVPLSHRLTTMQGRDCSSWVSQAREKPRCCLIWLANC